MAEVVLKKKQKEVLKINIEGKTYSLPLGGSVPYKTLKTLKTEDGMFDFLGKHIPEEVMDELTSDDITQIIVAWTNATKKASGLSTGES